MPDPVDALILDLLEWIGPKARPYREVIEAWRTSCPRLPVWEEANQRGFIERHHAPGSEAVVSVSAQGAKFLAEGRQVFTAFPSSGLGTARLEALLPDSEAELREGGFPS